MSEPELSTAPLPGAATVDHLFGEVYERLKQLARRHLGHRTRGTLDTTALVHELYLDLDKRPELAFQHPSQFFAYAARAMRHLLMNRARHRMRLKAGGDWVKVTFTSDLDAALESAEQALALDEALTRLQAADERAAQVIELRYFAGLEPGQIAELLGLSRRTVDRDWRFACVFLHTQLD